MSEAFFVAGTDTGVGKTTVACALLAGFAAQGKRVVGMKPVAAGCDERGRSADVEMLRAAGNVIAPDALVNPYRFAPPIAPHVAAARAGVEIDCEAIVRALERLRATADVVIVEGVGGWRVPLTDAADTADLAQRLALPVILVVGMRLGCLNHALLAVEAIRTRRLELAGWVANHVDPRMAAADENVAALRGRLGCPMLARVPFAASPDPRQVAGCFEWPAPASAASAKHGL